jgi:hypothetical protein
MTAWIILASVVVCAAPPLTAYYLAIKGMPE